MRESGVIALSRKTWRGRPVTKQASLRMLVVEQ